MILYKYYGPDRKEFLENRFVRFTPPHCLNDPFECRPAPDFSGYREWLLQQALHHNRSPEMRKTLKRLGRTRGFADRFSKDSIKDISEDQLYEKWFETVDYLMSKVGLLCLAATPVNQLLWAHYAASHTGFAVGFDSTHSFFSTGYSCPSFTMPPVREVDYRDTRVRFSAVPRGKTYGWDFAFHKSLDWKYESEWRLIRPLDTASKTVGTGSTGTVHLFEIPRESIREVLLGALSSEELMRHVEAANGRDGLTFEIKRAKCSRDRYEMDLFEV